MKVTMHDIVDTASGAGTFKTFLAAISAAGLTATLKELGPISLFAPDDKAFDKLAPGVIDELVKPVNKSKLATILNLHMIPGMVLCGELVGKKLSLKSVNGVALLIDGGNGVTVNSARVVKADIACTNGVIHVIDRVLLPKPAATARAA